MDSVVITGQFNLVDSNNNVKVPFNLTELFGTITNVLEHNKNQRQLVDTDGVVALDPGGVSNIRGLILVITSGSGTVTLKHDSNTNGIELEKGIMLIGNLSDITIETTSAQPLTIEHMFFE
jgi:hypothetical protein